MTRRTQAHRRERTSRESPREKPCAACGRPMRWRKRWERCWDAVRFCSDACRKRGAKA